MANKLTPPIHKLKHNASIRGIRPEMAVAFTIVSSVYNAHGIPCVLTSGTDGKHGRGSFHYNGLALDFRTRNITAKAIDDYASTHCTLETDPNSLQYYDTDARQDFIEQSVRLIYGKIIAALGPDFDVVLESNHIHIEFQPKDKLNA